MSEKQNIDRLFQEKFKDFEVNPPDSVWKGIESKLTEKEDRKVLPLWFRLAGIAAALLIGILFVDQIGLFGTGIDNPNTVVIDNTTVDSLNVDPVNPTPTNSVNGSLIDNQLETNNQNSGLANENLESDTDATTPSTQQRKVLSQPDLDGFKSRARTNRRNRAGRTNVNAAVAGTQSKAAIDKPNINSGVAQTNTKDNNGAQRIDNNRQIDTKTVDRSGSENQIAAQNKNVGQNPINSNELIDKNIPIENNIADTGNETKTDSTAIATVVPNALEELLNEKENKTVTADEPKLNRWQISSNVAPIYFSSTSSGSPLDSQLASNGKEYKADMAYGLGVRYAINKKMTLRAGVNTIGMEYYTNDLAFVQTTNARKLENVEPNIRGTMIRIEGKPSGTNSLEPVTTNAGRKFSSSLSQRTAYIEVPVEMSYKLLDKRFGIDVIGGVSTLFLSENSVSLLTSGIEMEIGKANNLSDTHFSTNLGVGFHYSFFKNFQFSVEPMFKYQINTFTNSGTVNPFIFGLYSGINYRF